MADPRKKGPRVIGAIIILLIVLFFAIEFFIRESQEFSPTRLTNVLLSSLQIIVLLLGLILFFVLGRNIVKLYLERKRKVVGAHFKIKLVMFFIALSFIPTLLLFIFASDFVSRNIEQWFQTPLDKLLDDTKSVADGFTLSTEELAYHDAQQLSRAIIAGRLINPENRPALRDFIRDKLTEYRLDEIGIFLDDEELFSYINPNMPLQDYRDLKANIVKRAQLGEEFRSIEPMGSGEMIRRGVSFTIPSAGTVLVTTGKFLPQNYAEKMGNIASYVQRYRQLKTQKNPVKSFYLMTLVFITILIIFAASWIGFHLAKGITVPIEKLAQATREVSRGNLDVKVEDPASDEIGTLIDSFNQMIFDLKTGQASIAQKTFELEGRKRYIETILDNISTGVLALDAKGAITTMNPSAREMLALADKDVFGKSSRDILGSAKYAELLRNIDWGMRNRYKLADQEITITDGQVTHLALALSPLKQTNGEFSGLIVVLDDLTQLIKAQKIAAWKEVAQRVAHEIKNPLTPIQLSAERIIKNLQKVRARPPAGHRGRGPDDHPGGRDDQVPGRRVLELRPDAEGRPPVGEHPRDRRPDPRPLQGHLHRYRIRGRLRPRRAGPGPGRPRADEAGHHQHPGQRHRRHEQEGKDRDPDRLRSGVPAGQHRDHGLRAGDRGGRQAQALSPPLLHEKERDGPRPGHRQPDHPGP